MNKFTQQLLRHKYPQGRFEDIFDEALELLLEKKDPLHCHSERNEVKRGIQSKAGSLGRSLGMTEKSGMTNKRYIPQEIRQEVWKRDNGQCSYVSLNGKPCGEKNFLELDHAERTFGLKF